ncbi:Peptidyl-tRNA hydrolase [Corynebacterium guangdongense]|uniref:Peptidyl-tRNA hydrolase n=1 Tax=Corynebacterium guangdongense TaxID=1783348 RepID=A0ABU1ZVC6_9CORY|nr:aminoacyl-tRNA hydrolase [Corynebacterium guangdongense]MDR7328882.1 PTH1 family peptidyl-tRNA hydrolase [Corynebacterium guangdongense]WJZ17457.1 Peptidyl-tRNA hydrolase [Corynebacterium guangdongense]
MSLWSRIFRPRPRLVTDWLVVGLGNPGEEYAATRHNVGYMALDDLLADAGDVLTPHGKALVCPVTWGGQKVLLMRSRTYMNHSGQALAGLDVPAERVIVLHDELDLPAHQVRLKKGGNENGHNGLKSITETLGTRDYLRVRIGIGRPPTGTPVPEHVLGPVDAGAGLDEAIAAAADAARLLVTEGLARAQNEIHSRR